MRQTMRVWSFVLGLVAVMIALPVMAQDGGKVWVQVEAQPDLGTAMDRARAYAATFPQVQGYRLNNGWYGISLGPMTSDDAASARETLLAQGAIPSDSYITNGNAFGAQYWPAGAQAATADRPTADRPIINSTTPVTPPTLAQPVAPDETVGEAKASEAALGDNDRMDVQAALKWFGFYDGKVDGHIGSGTRGSMANWQSSQAFEQTGVLTTLQRRQLVGAYKTQESGFGFKTVSEPESAIEITLPMAMLAFDRYTPPFVRYAPKNGSGLTALLMSEPGTTASLSALYNVLQSLEIVPADGARALEATSFTIHGKNDKIETLAHAEIVGSNVKGYLLSWDVSLSDQMSRVLPTVQASFRSSGDKAMDPGLVPLASAAKKGLLAGLDVKKPKLSQSGFFVDAKGSVLTSAAAVAQCGKITLDRSLPAKVSFTDAASGIAILTPEVTLSPKAVATFASAAPEAGAAVAVSGYSYQERLPAPVLTRGTMEEAQGLDGEVGLSRLSMQVLPGDAGGPVLDARGAVVGMLLPANAKAAKQLPQGVAFAASAGALTQLLTNPAGPALTLNAAAGAGKATPDALNAAARGMTVLVSCWE